MVNPQVVERRKTMLDSKWEKRARTELEAREREADLAAAAARAALMAEAQALTEAKRRADPNRPIVDGAETPRSEASDSEAEGSPGTASRASGTVSHRPSSPGSGKEGTGGGTEGSGRRARDKKVGGAGMEDVGEEGEMEGAGRQGGGEKSSSAAGVRSVAALTSGSMKKGLMGFSTRKSGSKGGTDEDKDEDKKKKRTEGNDVRKIEDNERRDAEFWVEQAEKLEKELGSKGTHHRALNKIKIQLKKDLVQQRKELKELEKVGEGLKKAVAEAPTHLGGDRSSTPALSLREVAEKMSKLECQVESSDRRLEDVGMRLSRCEAAGVTIGKLREWLQDQLRHTNEHLSSEHGAADLFRSRVLELGALVRAEKKEMGSSSEVLVVKVHRASTLEPDIDVQHPAVLVSVIDETREPGEVQKEGWKLPSQKSRKRPGGYLRKSDDLTIAVQQHEGRSVLISAEGEKAEYRSDSKGCEHILPVLTRPCPLLSLSSQHVGGGGEGSSLKAGVAPVWEEEIVFDQPPKHMLQDKVLYFFELVDFQVSSSTDTGYTEDEGKMRVETMQSCWKRIAWGFYRPGLEGLERDGSVSANTVLSKASSGSMGPMMPSLSFSRATRVAPGPANSFVVPGKLGSEVALQLYEYKTPVLGRLNMWRSRPVTGNPSDLGAGCFALDCWRDFNHDPRHFPRYPATLTVTVATKARPQSETIPRAISGEHGDVVQRCRIRRLDSDALSIAIELVFAEPVVSREVVQVALGKRSSRQKSFLKVISCVPVGSVLEARSVVGPKGGGGGVGSLLVQIVLATGFSGHDTLSLTLRLGDSMDRRAWEALYGDSFGWREVEADVERRRSMLPWQFERESPPQGELDSVALMRATGDTGKGTHQNAVVTTTSADDVEERRYDRSTDLWCRAPNSIKQSLPAFQNGCSVVEFSPCGRWLAAAMYSEQQPGLVRARVVIQVFDCRSGRVVAALEGHHDVIYDLQWVVVARRGSKGDKTKDKASKDCIHEMPALLSASKDKTVRAWLIVADTDRNGMIQLDQGGGVAMRGTLVSTAFHPGFCYCASWVTNPGISSSGANMAAAEMAAMLGDASAARAVAEARMITSLESSSHFITGCYDHAVRVWQACDPERVKPVPTVSSASIPTTADLWYLDVPAASAGGSLLVLLNPRVPVAANSAVTLLLPNFSLLPALQLDKDARLAKQHAARGGSNDKAGGDEALKKPAAAVSKQAITTLRSHMKFDERNGWFESDDAGADKAVAVEAAALPGMVRLTVTPQVDVDSEETWALLLPHELGLIAPWDSHEDKCLRKHVQAMKEEGGDNPSGQTGEEINWAAVVTTAAQSISSSYPHGELLNRSALELEQRWPAVQVSAREEDYEKPSKCVAFIPMPASAGSVGKLVWDLKISSMGEPAKETGDLTLTFTAGTQLLKDDVLALELPGVEIGPTFLGKSYVDHAGASWVAFCKLPSETQSMTPLSLYVPSVVSSKQHAILLVQVQESHAKGAQVSFSLKEIFGGHHPTPVIKSLKDAGIVVQIKASWPATATIQRHLGSCLSLIFNARSDMQPGDHVLFSMSDATLLPDGAGSVYLPTFPDPSQANIDSLDILDLTETSAVEASVRRWSQARVILEQNATAERESEVGGEVHAIECRCSANIHKLDKVCLTLARNGGRGKSLLAADGAPYLPVALLLHKITVKGAEKVQEGVVEWPNVDGQAQGRAWFVKSKLLHKVAKHLSFVNSLSVLPALDFTRPARLFTGDGQGVLRAWSIMADDKGSIALVHTKAMDLATMKTLDDSASGRTKMLPGLKEREAGRRQGEKENEDTQTKLKKLAAAIAPEAERHAARSIVCVRAHSGGEANMGRVATMSVDSLIRVLNATTLSWQYSLAGFVSLGPNACMKCAWSPDGQLIAAGSETGSLHVWRLPSPAGASLFVGHDFLDGRGDAGVTASTCSVVQPAYKGKGECAGVTWSPLHRELAVVVLSYVPARGDLSVESACDIVIDALDGKWDRLKHQVSGDWDAPLGRDDVRRCTKLLLIDSGVVPDCFEEALVLVFDFLAAEGVRGLGTEGAASGPTVPGRKDHGGGAHMGKITLAQMVKSLAPKAWASIKIDEQQQADRKSKAHKNAKGGDMK